jgi:integrase
VSEGGVIVRPSARESAFFRTSPQVGRRYPNREVLRREAGDVGELIRAKQPARLPVALTREEVRALLASLEALPRLFVLAADSGTVNWAAVLECLLNWGGAGHTV